MGRGNGGGRWSGGLSRRRVYPEVVSGRCCSVGLSTPPGIVYCPHRLSSVSLTVQGEERGDRSDARGRLRLRRGRFEMGLLSLYGKGLQGKFVKLGTLKGRTQSEIVASVGKPNSISAAAGGKRLVQWITPGYHIALL